MALNMYRAWYDSAIQSIDLYNIYLIFQANFWVIAANLGFSFLAVFHLAYLGIMFGSDSGEQEQVK